MATKIVDDSQEQSVSFHPLDEEAFGALKKDLAMFLAKRLTFSLFEPGKETELRNEVDGLVHHKLAHERLTLPLQTRKQLVTDILKAIPHPSESTPDQQEETPTANTDSGNDLLTLKKEMAPYLLSKLNERLFAAGYENALQARIRELVESRLIQEQISLSEESKESLIGDIFLSLSTTSQTEESVLGNKESLQENRGGSDEMDPELRKNLIFHLAAELDLITLSTTKRDIAYKEIQRVLNIKCTQDKITLSAPAQKTLIEDVLSGQNMEFQL